MHLLLEILFLCTDAQPMRAIQTLFRTLQLYGAMLGLDILDKWTSACGRSRSRPPVVV